MITDLLIRLRILPRWVIIIIDLLIVSFSTFLAYLLRFNFDLTEITDRDIQYGILTNLITFLIAILSTKSYAGIVRYTGMKDGVRLLYTLLFSTTLSSFINLIFYYNSSRNLIPYSVVFISFLASFLFLFQYRLLIKNIFEYYRKTIRDKQNVAIFGAGQFGILTKQLIDGSDDTNYKVVAFFEDDVRKAGKVINGTRIYDAKTNLELALVALEVSELIIAVQNLSFERKNEIVDLCLRENIKVRAVPQVKDWVKGELRLNHIKEINIEDLLGRESIKLNNEIVSQQILSRRVCVTGAAGSIGKELVRQVIQYHPSMLILIDQAESALYEVERELEDGSRSVDVLTYVADIGNYSRMDEIMRTHQPEIVFHAAAYKHVPLMEKNPVEAVLCNVFGTKNIADLSVKYGVSKFVMISTDKAVNPTNVMGCSKRISEIYVQSLNNYIKTKGKSNTHFVTTRFGNVLGSNGSVIPYFKKQIASGGPVTVTHPEITRYFMTITEACQLVLEAGAMGQGGEIFLFDMGQSIKIVDLAKKMIKLSGLELNKDIEIVYTGLRQGEKLYEELLASKENTIQTHHAKIMIAKVQEYEYEVVLKKMDELYLAASNNLDGYEIVKIMKDVVPEFKSNSSRYTILDEK